MKLVNQSNRRSHHIIWSGYSRLARGPSAASHPGVNGLHLSCFCDQDSHRRPTP